MVTFLNEATRTQEHLTLVTYVYGELEYHYDAADKESVLGAKALIEEEDKLAMDRQDPLASCNFMLAIGSGPQHNRRLERLSSMCRNFEDWQKKIKDTFDPKYLSDPSAYVVYKGNLIKKE